MISCIIYLLAQVIEYRELQRQTSMGKINPNKIRHFPAQFFSSNVLKIKVSIKTLLKMIKLY
uniref:Uncharacterized protein n=1 Tax=Anguilla anguilla TaxID=7936 RepID=A0A0E9RRV8_ANGAN